MQQKLEEKDENTLEIKETFTSLQQEVDIKTKKLKKVSIYWQAFRLYKKSWQFMEGIVEELTIEGACFL